jgi:hypothetical protein
MEEKKRPAEDPLEGAPCEKRQRVDWKDDYAWLLEHEKVGSALLDPNTWVPHIVGEFKPTAQNPLPPLETILRDIFRSLEDILAEITNARDSWRSLGLCSAHLGSLPPIIFECRLFKEIYLDPDAAVSIIPTEIGQWEGRRLDFARTGFLRLPHEIGDCQQLQFVDLFESRIQELPRRLGKCPELRCVFLGPTMAYDPLRPRLWQFQGLDGDQIATKLKRDWASYVTSMSCFVFCLESRICKETAEGISGDIPRDILPRIASFI